VTFTASVASDGRYFLGEGASWDADRQLLRWVDIDAGLVLEGALDEGMLSGTSVVRRSDTTVSASARARDGGLLLAEGRSLTHVSHDGSTVARYPIIPDQVASRLNDGAVDPAGRFLVGSLATDGRAGEERLWRLEGDGTVTVIDHDLTISNGLGWSPDGGTLYSIDSVPGTIWQRTYDPDGAGVGRRHLLTTITDGEPDGMTVDADGTLWIAVWGRGEVVAVSPDGSVEESVTVAAPLTTSCAFAGPELSTLVITTAAKAVPGFPSVPPAGALFAAAVGKRGRAPTTWNPTSVPEREV
jgi:sugar lactone lactonase YvrE